MIWIWNRAYEICLIQLFLILPCEIDSSGSKLELLKHHTKKRTSMFNSRHKTQIWVIDVQWITAELCILISIKNDNSYGFLIWINFKICSRNLLQINFQYLLSPLAKCPWKRTSSKIATAICFFMWNQYVQQWHYGNCSTITKK